MRWGKGTCGYAMLNEEDLIFHYYFIFTSTNCDNESIYKIRQFHSLACSTTLLFRSPPLPPCPTGIWGGGTTPQISPFEVLKKPPKRLLRSRPDPGTARPCQKTSGGRGLDHVKSFSDAIVAWSRYCNVKFICSSLRTRSSAATLNCLAPSNSAVIWFCLSC